jgi:hypothetical protein
MKTKYQIRAICKGYEMPFSYSIICEDSKEELIKNLKNSYSTGFDLNEEDIELIIKPKPIKKYRFTYKYKDCVINLILNGTDQLDAFKEFNKYAKKFKLPLNSNTNIKVKELKVVNNI